MKPPAITKPFKQKRKIVVVMLCVILACTSCKKDDLLIDIKGEPDKVMENAYGILYYDRDLKVWYISFHYAGVTDDTGEHYMIAERRYKNFVFKDDQVILFSGFCYEIPRDIYRNFAVKNGTNIIAGTT